MERYTFIKRRKAIYSEEEQFEVEARNYDTAKTMAMSFLYNEVDENDHVFPQQWIVDCNSVQYYSLELNDGFPTIVILDEEKNLLADNAHPYNLPIDPSINLCEWWDRLPQVTKNIFSCEVIDNLDEETTRRNDMPVQNLFFNCLISQKMQERIYLYWRARASRFPMTEETDWDITSDLACELAKICLDFKTGANLDELVDSTGYFIPPYNDMFWNFFNRITGHLSDFEVIDE